MIKINDTSDPNMFDTTEQFEIIKPEITIVHNHITVAKEFDTIEFKATVTVKGTSKIETVNLYYRMVGREDFDKLGEMNMTGEDEYSFTLGAGNFKAPGLDYYITARDTKGLEACLPATVGFYSICAEVEVLSSGEDKKVLGGTEQNAYQMMSIPLTLKETSF